METRQRVLAAADELGYVPSRAAQALAKGRVATVGVVAPFATSASVLERVQGLATRLTPTAYDMTLFSVETPTQRREVLDELASPQRVGAVILISLPPTTEEVAAFRAAGVPLIAIDARSPDVDCVYIDNAEGGRMVARHLLASGHRRMAFVGDVEDHPMGFSSSRDRRIAFEDVLATASLQMPARYLKLGPHNVDFARDATAELLALDEPPTAVFAASDIQAMGVLEAAADADVAVPDRLSVFGFDDIGAARALGLTTIRQPLEESGAYGAKLTLEALEHEPMGIAIELPLSLVVRRTTGPPPASR
jgi:LacI family transcriptional regulator/LacI family repressor for deo operon, udp, cdd, tsx, nupC, and nupG